MITFIIGAYVFAGIQKLTLCVTYSNNATLTVFLWQLVISGFGGCWQVNMFLPYPQCPSFHRHNPVLSLYLYV